MAWPQDPSADSTAEAGLPMEDVIKEGETAEGESIAPASAYEVIKPLGTAVAVGPCDRVMLDRGYETTVAVMLPEEAFR